jgi:hypothetical protein
MFYGVQAVVCKFTCPLAEGKEKLDIPCKCAFISTEITTYSLLLFIASFVLEIFVVI